MDVKQRNKAAHRGERVVHRVDRPARRVRGDRRKERRIEDAKAHFLALHVAVGGINAKSGEIRIAGRLVVPANERAREEDNQHGRPDRPAVLLVSDRAAKVISQRR